MQPDPPSKEVPEQPNSEPNPGDPGPEIPEPRTPGSPSEDPRIPGNEDKPVEKKPAGDPRAWVP